MADANTAADPPDATALAAALAAGSATSEQIVRDCHARIARLERTGPKLHSVIALNPDALAIARERDAERKLGRVRGPLHGVPVLVKDNIASGDRMATTAGSLALAGVRAPRDAHVVARLRDAGAVILGKNNLSEWANIRSLRATSGWSALGGLAKNPHALDRNASGSSSGTAVAVAAGLAPLGVGTETDGSIVSPASINGVVGLKPTVGRISRDGVVPISRSQDTPGPMARSVADAALLFAALTGVDPNDAATAAAPRDLAGGGVALPADALKGARIGVARAYFTDVDAIDALIEQAIGVMRRLGAEIIDPVDLAPVSWGDADLRVLLAEMKVDLPAYLAAFAPDAPVRSLADVIAFNRAHREQEMAWFGQELLEKAEAMTGGLRDPAYLAALAQVRRAARDDGLDRVLAAHRLDAIVAPTGGVAWLSDFVQGDHFGASFSSPAAVAGYPHLTVPAGFAHGLPVGLSFVGAAWSEPRLLALGHAFEQATGLRRPPAFAERSTPAD